MKTIFITAFIFFSIKASSQNFTYEIPFRYDENNRHILIDVEVNGSKEKKTFIFDTGGKNILNRSHFSFTKGKKRIKIKTLTMGEFEVKNTKFRVHDWVTKFPATKFMRDADGMIGSLLMKDYAWLIDYTEKKLLISNDVATLLAKVNPKFTLPIRRVIFDFSLYAELKIDDDTKVSTAIDTGSPSSISGVEKTFTGLLKNEQLKYKTDSISVISYMTGGKKVRMPRYNVEFENGKLGNINLKNYEVSFSKYGYNLIGNKFLENFIVILDWKNKIVYLQPSINSKFVFEDKDLWMTK